MKITYKDIAVQDECLGGGERDPRIFIYVKMEGQGKTKKYYKVRVEEFPNVHYLDKFLEDTRLPVVAEQDFGNEKIAEAIALSRASSSNPIPTR